MQYTDLNIGLLFLCFVQQLRRRDEECKRLSRVRDDLDNEVEELTASLFQVEKVTNFQ